jgi:hypothetical protein
VALDMFPMPLDQFEEWKRTHPLGAAWDAEERRADVLTFDPDGRNEKIFATGSPQLFRHGDPSDDRAPLVRRERT